MSREFFKERENALGEKVIEAYLITGGSPSELEARLETMRLGKRAAGFSFQAFSVLTEEVCLLVSNKPLTEAECTNAKSLALAQGNFINLSREIRVLKAHLIMGATGNERVTKIFELIDETKKSFAYARVGCVGRMMEEETLGLLVSNKEVSNVEYSKEFIVQLAVEQGNTIDLTPASSLQCGK